MDVNILEDNLKNGNDTEPPRCYICDEFDGNNFKQLITLRSIHTKSKIVDIISRLLGEQFTIIIAENDNICLKCLNIINNIDKLELDLERERSIIMKNIGAKYKIDITTTTSGDKCEKFTKNIKDIVNIKHEQEYFEHKSEIISDSNHFQDILNQNNTDTKNLFFNTKLAATNCLQCQQQFENNVQLQNHLKEHSIFSCQICKHPFSNYFQFKNHLIVCSQTDLNKQYKCNKCNRDFFNDTCTFCEKNNNKEHINNVDENKTKELLGELLLFKHDDDDDDDDDKNEKNETINDLLVEEKDTSPHKEYRAVYLCQICNFETPIDTEMKSHIDTHTKNGYKCNKCLAIFKTAQSLEVHQSKHSADARPVTCNLCNVQCVDKLHLRSHKKNVHKVHLTCHYCKYVCKNRKELQLHTQKHNGNRKFECEKCKQIFTREVLLKCHQEYAHRVDKKCKFCGKEILILKELRLHEKRHKRYLNTNLKCPHCEKILKTKTGLKVHVAKHTGDYKFFCEVCGRGCMSLIVLQEHMGVHTKEERYICDVCGKKFCFNATYRVHRMWHDNPKPYTCKDCGKNFAHTSLLAVHRRREHTGERPYVCGNCHMAFTRSTSLKRHQRIHTGERPYVCVWCKKGFIERNLWAKHLANEHDDYTAINNRQKCEYKMVIKPEQNETNNVGDLKLDRNTNEHDEEMQEFIIIGNTNLENVVFYGLPSNIDETTKTNVEETTSILMEHELEQNEPQSEPQPQLLEGIDETNIIIKTEEGDMVIRNGQLVPLTNVL